MEGQVVSHFRREVLRSETRVVGLLSQLGVRLQRGREGASPRELRGPDPPRMAGLGDFHSAP